MAQCSVKMIHHYSALNGCAKEQWRVPEYVVVAFLAQLSLVNDAQEFSFIHSRGISEGNGTGLHKYGFLLHT